MPSGCLPLTPCASHQSYPRMTIRSCCRPKRPACRPGDRSPGGPRPWRSGPRYRRLHGGEVSPDTIEDVSIATGSPPCAPPRRRLAPGGVTQYGPTCLLRSLIVWSHLEMETPGPSNGGTQASLWCQPPMPPAGRRPAWSSGGWTVPERAYPSSSVGVKLYFRMKRSTRPAVSTILCFPV